MNKIREENFTRLHAIVHGRVQGVGFRYFVQKNAQALYLTGWVRNTPQGNVEVIAEGPSYVLDRLLMFLQEGPRSAQVTDLETEEDAEAAEHGAAEDASAAADVEDAVDSDADAAEADDGADAEQSTAKVVQLPRAPH